MRELTITELAETLARLCEPSAGAHVENVNFALDMGGTIAVYEDAAGRWGMRAFGRGPWFTLGAVPFPSLPDVDEDACPLPLAATYSGPPLRMPGEASGLPGDPRVVDGVYHDGYWHADYAVTAMWMTGCTRWLLVEWLSGSRDVRSAVHCTEWNPARDRVVACHA